MESFHRVLLCRPLLIWPDLHLFLKIFEFWTGPNQFGLQRNSLIIIIEDTAVILALLDSSPSLD
jgi:hypothetical protein